jgi:hypothetical protein
MTPQELQKVLDETGGIEIFAETGMRNLQELRWVLLGSAGMKLPPPAKKTTDLEGKADQRGSSESHPGAGRTPSTKLVNAINQLFVVLLPNGMVVEPKMARRLPDANR